MNHQGRTSLSKLNWVSLVAAFIASFGWLSVVEAQLSPTSNFQPTLDLNFLTASSLTSAGTLTRASNAYYYNAGGTLTSVASNVPRFDHEPSTGLRKGLLMEPAATNILPYSEDHATGWWVVGTATLNYNNAVAPDGTTTATKFTDQVSGADQHGIGFNIDATAFTSSVDYTISTYIKAGSTSLVEVYGYNKAGVYCSYRVDLTGNGSISTVNADWGDNGVGSNPAITKAANGWYRVQFTMNVGAGGGWPGFLIRLTDGTLSWYNGDASHNAYVWGGQVELGTTASSYIKTTGAAATRASDSLTSTLGTWFSPKTGTLRAQYINLDATSTNPYRMFSLAALNAAGSYYNDGFFLGDQGTSVVSAIRSGSANTFAPSGTISGTGQVNRQALTYTPASYAFSLNGSAPSTVTTGSLPATDPAYFYIGSQPGGLMRPRWIQTIQFYNQRLRNELLGDATSIPTSLTYQSSGGSAADAAAYTFSSKAIGTAASNRYVIVGVAARAGATQNATSVTIGGIAASNLISSNISNDAISFWAANVPTGTTADVIVNFSGSMSRCGVVVYSVLHSKMPSVTASASYNDTTFNGTLPVYPGEVGLGVLYANGATDMNWSGYTEDIEYDLVEIGARFTGASATFTGYKSNFSVNNGHVGGYTNRGGLAITLK